jgi:hypothetical protein
VSKRAVVVFVVLLLAIVALGSIGTEIQAQRAKAGPPARVETVAAPAPKCDPFQGLQRVEVELYHTLNATQPGLRFEQPGVWRTMNYGDNDPLRGATKIGDCDFRVRSFITVGNATIRYTARATMRDGEWQVGELEMAQ